MINPNIMHALDALAFDSMLRNLTFEQFNQRLINNIFAGDVINIHIDQRHRIYRNYL